MIGRFSGCVGLSLALLALAEGQAQGQTRDRGQVEARDTWKLEDIYPSDQAWDQARKELVGQFDGILAFKGQLAGSSAKLLECLEMNSRISKELTRLGCYASMKLDQDARSATYQGLKQQIEQISTDYNSKASFIEPEIAAMDKAVVDGFIAKEKGLAVYRMTIDDIQRTKAHRLSDKEEKILAETGLMAGAPHAIFSVFSDAELPYPEITLSDGTKALLTKAGFSRYRTLADRADREAVFNAFWAAFERFKATFAAELNAQVRKDMFYAKARGYGSCLQSSLDRNAIPVEVYQGLIANVNKNLGSFHRYLALKKRMLGVDQLRYSDVYAPVVKDLQLHYTYDQAQQLVLDAVKPLGEDYVATVKQSFDRRWIDVYPTTGKRSGAYSNGSCYDVHPYILLNFNGQYDDVSTLAHELGHTMHSFYSNKVQPYPTADYSIFVAEVASTLNEALLIDRMLKTIQDDNTRLTLLMNRLDGIKGTVFRQTQFAEFELAIHQKAEAGEPLTGESLTRLYGDIARKYYGHDQGVCKVDDLYCLEWAFIPHFYMNFYVYQYATSFTASTTLSQQVLSGAPGAAKGYLDFLSSGGSEYPIPTLKKAGVDMLTSEPFDKTMAEMNRIMDQIEAILAGK
jgi:oligoendopeptidase F